MKKRSSRGGGGGRIKYLEKISLYRHKANGRECLSGKDRQAMWFEVGKGGGKKNTPQFGKKGVSCSRNTLVIIGGGKHALCGRGDLNRQKNRFRAVFLFKQNRNRTEGFVFRGKEGKSPRKGKKRLWTGSDPIRDWENTSHPSETTMRKTRRGE